jgi:hypothetical protein
MAAIDQLTPAPRSRFPAGHDWATIALATVAIAGASAALVLGLTSAQVKGLVPQNALGAVANVILVATFVVVGLILRRKRPEHAIGWLLLLFAASIAVGAALWGATYVSGLPGRDPALGRWLALLGSVLTIPVWSFLGTSLVVRFPSGRPESDADARLLRYSAVACVAAGFLALVRPGPFIAYPGYSNPISVPPALAAPITIAASVAVVAVVLPGGLAVWNMVGRYRRAQPTERLQLRWFAFAGLLTVPFGFLLVGIDLLARDHPLRDLVYVAVVLAACGLPIAMLQAITRYHLYDIDTIIGRTFAYGALTAILAGLYSASLRLFNAIFVSTTGENSEIALVLTTLVLATTFTPIKSRLEKLAARRFQPVAPGSTGRAPIGPSGTEAQVLDAATLAAIEVAARRAVDAALSEREIAAGSAAPTAAAGKPLR